MTCHYMVLSLNRTFSAQFNGTGSFSSDKVYIEMLYDHNLQNNDAKDTFRFRMFLFII